MDKMIEEYLSKLELGELQQFENMGVIPLFSSVNHSPDYVTLKDAMDKHYITITEVNKGGSVPELMVTNNGDVLTLLLDGEELAGAKQNRVLNTSILLDKKSETVIPVSCTEHGRWSYNSPAFRDSKLMMSSRIRGKKSSSVTHNLYYSNCYNSDQSEVWNEIAMLQDKANVKSPTGAMKDTYEAKKKDLEEYQNQFPYQPQQKGLLVFLNGEIAGFDLISRETAYQVLHPKLVKSYAMDALLEHKNRKPEISQDVARSFLGNITTGEEKKYKSTGLGWDYRYQKEQSVGSALVNEDKVIHMAFFHTTGKENNIRMSGHHSRRSFRE